MGGLRLQAGVTEPGCIFFFAPTHAHAPLCRRHFIAVAPPPSFKSPKTTTHAPLCGRTCSPLQSRRQRSQRAPPPWPAASRHLASTASTHVPARTHPQCHFRPGRFHCCTQTARNAPPHAQHCTHNLCIFTTPFGTHNLCIFSPCFFSVRFLSFKHVSVCVCSLLGRPLLIAPAMQQKKNKYQTRRHSRGVLGDTLSPSVERQTSKGAIKLAVNCPSANIMSTVWPWLFRRRRARQGILGSAARLGGADDVVAGITQSSARRPRTMPLN